MTQRHPLDSVARNIRRDILTSTTKAGSGHPSSCLSAVELMTSLFFDGHFKADLRRPTYRNNDRLLFSKGHAAPLLYALYAAAGAVSHGELIRLRTRTSMLEGHPMPSFPFTEAPTGSLGQGLSVGIGIALSARMDRLPFRTYVLLGDSEMAEGSVWEAIQFAGHAKLDNLTAILDVNRLGQRGPTMLGHDCRAYARRIESFGWKTIIVDGHDLRAISTAYRTARTVTGKPVMVIAKTIKGKGVSFIENKNGWHGKTLTISDLTRALKELGPIITTRKVSVVKPRTIATTILKKKSASVIAYHKGMSTSTRQAIGNALVRLAPRYPNLVVLDGEVENSTYTELFDVHYPKRFIESYIAEQNMVGIANGLASRGTLPVAATFAAFLTRAHDQLRMAQYAGTHQVFIGTHAGVSIGQDGASQMGLEDIAMFRSLEGSTVLYPADAVTAEKLTDCALAHSGIVYLRAGRNPAPLLYPSTASFSIGGSTTFRTSRNDKATIVAAGVTLNEAFTAADELQKQGIAIRVIDCYSVKPIDATTLKKAARETAHLIVVEDHRPEGGLADAVRSALGLLAGTVISLAVQGVPHSATSAQLLHTHRIDASAIINAVKRTL